MNNKDFLPSVLFFLSMFLLVNIFSSKIVQTQTETHSFFAFLWSLFVSLIGLAMFYIQKISFYRKIFFITLAVGFLIHFKLSLFGKISQIWCVENAPYCHIAITSTFLNYPRQIYSAFMEGGDWRLWLVVSMSVLWVFVAIIIGRAWCSWTCFYGGIDELCSCILKKPVINIKSFAFKFRDLPMAILIFFLLISFSYMIPAYCIWLCPFKITTTFLDKTLFIRNLQIVLMILAGICLILLSFLAKKRVFCSFLCPFSAWQSFWGKLNPFRIAIDMDKCSVCKKCIDVCPVYAIRFDEDKKIKISDYCNLCGSCRGACHDNAISYTVFGIKFQNIHSGFGKLMNPESIFIFSTLIWTGTFGSLFMPAAMNDLIKLIIKL